MSRMLQAYSRRFAERLRALGARRIEQGLHVLMHRARRQRSGSQHSLFPTLHALDVHLQKSLLRYRSQQNHAAQPSAREAQHATPPCFVCDSGLGGLARWLRATGYHAIWKPRFDDTEALELALRRRAILLTTDGPLMERRLIRTRRVLAFWIPPTLAILEQLALVRREYGLALGNPRCMSCGGLLGEVTPHSVWDRIPPRTRLWLDRYFVCQDCDQLFWHGTHWRRIRDQLDRPLDG